MLLLKSYFQPEKSLYKMHHHCVSRLLTFKDLQRKLVNFTVGWGGKKVPNCRTWKFRFESENQVGPFSFHHCSGVAQANESRPDHAVWAAFWMEPRPWFSQQRWLLNRSSGKKISWVVSKGILEWTGILPLSFNGTEISSCISPKWPQIQLPYEICWVKGYRFYIFQVKFHLNYVAVLTVRHFFMLLGFLGLRQM